MNHVKQKLTKIIQQFEGLVGSRYIEDNLQNENAIIPTSFFNKRTITQQTSGDILLKLNKISRDFDLESIKHINKQTVNECLLDFNIYLKMLIHELRTPLSTISIGLDILESECKNETDRQTIDDLKQNIIFIENIFTNFAVIKDGKIELNIFTPFSLEDMLQKISILLQFHIKKENVSFRFIISPDAYNWNYGDVHNLKHCIINLIKNSIKYRELSRLSVISIQIIKVEKIHNKKINKPTPPASAKRTINIKRSQMSSRLIKNMQMISIRIIDNNNHILPNIKEKLFEPFNSTSGSGLGLYICKNIIDLYGGTITHNFIEPIGNEFSITLSLEIYENNSCKLLSSICVSEDRICSRPIGDNLVIEKYSSSKDENVFIILLVDDSILNTRMMHKMLKNMNIFNNIYISSDGNDAIEKISSNLLSINVIFLDKHMPNLDGITTAKKLRELSYNNLIFGVTGDDNSTEIANFLNSGVDNVLIKPLNIIVINMVIKFIKKNGVIRKKNSTIINVNGELNWSGIE